MTLFWHGQFATSADKVSAYRMWLQNETIRRYALANFSVTPTPSPTPALNKALVGESAMAEIAMNALAENPRSMRVTNPQNTLNQAQNTGAPTHNAAQTPPKAPEPQVIPPPAPTPPPRVTGGLPIGRIITADDRTDPRRLVEKLSTSIFQATPETVLF